MKITLEMFRNSELSESQISLFAALYPDGIEVTEDSARSMAEAGMEITDLAAAVMSPATYDVYLQATRLAYQEYLGTAGKAYDDYAAANKLVCYLYRAASDDADAATAAAARQAYVEASEAAWEIYRSIDDAARKVFRLACVPHFVAALNAESGEVRG